MSVMEYREIPIIFNGQTGKFSANVNGEEVESGSLASIKSKIAKKLDEKFPEFEALEYPKYGVNEKSSIQKIRITKCRKEKSKYGSGSPFFLDSEGNRHYSIYVASPENEAVMQTLLAHDLETRKIDAFREKERKALHAKLRVVEARTFPATA